MNFIIVITVMNIIKFKKRVNEKKNIIVSFLKFFFLIYFYQLFD
jgi:hypothetical protein